MREIPPFTAADEPFKHAAEACVLAGVGLTDATRRLRSAYVKVAVKLAHGKRGRAARLARVHRNTLSRIEFQ